MTTLVTTADVLNAVCRRYNAGRLSDRILAAATIEALGAGVDAKAVLAASGIVPSSLPRYATLVAAGFFEARS